jgi:hypothetical protein
MDPEEKGTSFDLDQVEPSQSNVQDIEMAPQSQPVSPNPSRSPSPAIQVSSTLSQPGSQNLSQSPSPADGTPAHCSPSCTKFPTSLSKKRKGDSLKCDALKRVQTNPPTTTHRSTRSKASAFHRSTHSKTSAARRLPGPIAQLRKTQSSRRHESSPNLSSTTSLPPAWFLNSFAMLQNNEPPLGNRWAELLRLWSGFEEKENFTEQQKLSPDGRPQCISEWIHCGHSTTWRPVILSIPAPEKSFEAWWINL